MVAAQENKALALLSKVEDLLAALEADRDYSTNDGPFWLFGTSNPTALDAHLVPFIARLLDVGRKAMLSGKVLAYAKRALESEIWKEAMQGRKTVYGTYL